MEIFSIAHLVSLWTTHADTDLGSSSVFIASIVLWLRLKKCLRLYYSIHCVGGNVLLAQHVVFEAVKLEFESCCVNLSVLSKVRCNVCTWQWHIVAALCVPSLWLWQLSCNREMMWDVMAGTEAQWCRKVAVCSNIYDPGAEFPARTFTMASHTVKLLPNSTISDFLFLF